MIMKNFKTYGQYIYDTRDDTIHSVEFLARPVEVNVPMDLDAFFSLVESPTLERWFLYQLEQAALFYKLTGIRAHINLDARTLGRLNAKNLTKLVGTDIQVAVEITQIQGLPIHEEVNYLHSLAPDNVKIVLDDLDIKNNLEELQKYKFHEVKIDRSMVEAVENDFHIAKKLKDIKKAFDVEMIVEGVENIHQLLMLQKLGFNIFQGFYFSKPESLQDIFDNLGYSTNKEDLNKILYKPAIPE